MYYPELLRAWRLARVFLIVFAALIVISGIGKIFAPNHFGVVIDSSDTPDGSKVIKKTLPDGTVIKSYTDKRGGSVTITQRGAFEKVVINDPGKKTQVMTHDMHVQWSALMMIAGGFGGFVAVLLGLALARENDGHLELAWTKPVSREVYAATIFAIDYVAALGITAAFLVMIAIIFAMSMQLSLIYFDASALSSTVLTLVVIAAMYATITAASASMRRAGTILGIAYPALLLMPPMTQIKWMSIGSIIRVIDTVNPVAYYYAYIMNSIYNSWGGLKQFTIATPAEATVYIALILITIVGLLAALVQWRRLEA